MAYRDMQMTVAPERSAETKVGGGGGEGQALFVINGLPHQSFVYSECSGATGRWCSSDF